MSWYFFANHDGTHTGPFEAQSIRAAFCHARKLGVDGLVIGEFSTQLKALEALRSVLALFLPAPSTASCALCEMVLNKSEMDEQSRVCDKCINGMERLEMEAHHV